MKYSFFLLFSLLMLEGMSQKNNYHKSIKSYQEKYVQEHGVLKGQDRSSISFFPIDAAYKVEARLERVTDAEWFNMETSSGSFKTYRTYGIAHFSIHGTPYQLRVYQSKALMQTKDYADHLFIPFTDLTTGTESYENGRYLDVTIQDIQKGKFIIDFNKAYNPYCAYGAGMFNCPRPPAENDLLTEINAGEKRYTGKLNAGK